MGGRIFEITALFPVVFVLAGLTFTVVIDPYISRNHRRIMLAIIALSIVLIAQNIVEDSLAGGQFHWLWRTAASVVGYSVRPVFLILFLYIVQPNRKHLIWWRLAAVNCAVYMTEFFSRLSVWIDADNHYRGGPLSDTCLIVCAVLLAELLLQSVRMEPAGRKRDAAIHVLLVVMLVAALILDYQVGSRKQPVTFLTMAIIVCSVFYYIWLHLQFVREHEDDLKAKQRIQIMLSQIQPHFLYNTLSAIQYLCSRDPKAAEETTGKFARYLQGNMNALSGEETIPFSLELEHTRLYLEIEQVRYEDAMRVIYDVTCTDFSLPPLTLQPIAENAVRHGARGSEKEVGTVRIATREYPDRYEITVTDDGPGFDPEHIAPPDDGRAHIGIQNVRTRLESVCGGVLRYTSEPDGGTTAALVIPKRKEKAPC